MRVVLPADPLLGHPEQEIVARLWRRRQTETGWVFQVGLPSYEGSEAGTVQAAEYRVWVRAPEHARPVDGVDYDQVPTDRLEASAWQRAYRLCRAHVGAGGPLPQAAGQVIVQGEDLGGFHLGAGGVAQVGEPDHRHLRALPGEIPPQGTEARPAPSRRGRPRPRPAC